MELKAMPIARDVDAEMLDALLAQRRIIYREEMIETLRHIKPVVRRDTGLHKVDIGYRDVHYVSFLDDPIISDEPIALREYETILTLHRFGFASQFRPTLAEVIMMIPADLPANVIAFETIGPENEADLMWQATAIGKGFHVANTILYTAEH